MAAEESPFLSRWSRRKLLARQGEVLAPEPERVPVDVTPDHAPAPAPRLIPSPAQGAAPDVAQADADKAPERPPLPTLADVANLARASDYSAFVGTDVAPEVRNAALKKLFTDPHYNVMDGLDIYIDDYGKPDPLPQSMLRQMVQAQFLGLFKDEEPQTPAPDQVMADATRAATLPPQAPEVSEVRDHEDPAVQLQSDDDPGRPGAEPGAGQDSGRAH